IGFDEYCLWQAAGRRGSRYADPVIIENGKWRDNTRGKYGPDIVCDYVLDFIDRNQDKPFLAYYPMLLPHSPHEPTPLSQPGRDEQGYFADMVAYMDQNVGRIVQRLDELKLSERTIVVFTGDNGTNRRIRSRLGDQPIRGGKGTPTIAGTHVPLVARWQGQSPAGVINDNLIDFTDFLPTFCEAAGVPLPREETFDGVSFLAQIRGRPNTPRSSIFCYYEPQHGNFGKAVYAHDQRWKLYDDGRFFDLVADPGEKNPLVDNQPKIAAAEARAARERLQVVLDQKSREAERAKKLRASVETIKPLALHPDNPHYFLFRDKPAVLITSGEHYGAVLNLDFDYLPYLDELTAHGFNQTRTFSGVYRELPSSSFPGIKENTLAPAAGRFVCPWGRSSTPVASDGGNQFDLDKWDPAYFQRLKDFVGQAGKRGIVVELVFFCTMYNEELWQASPMRVINNVNGVGDVERHEVYSFKDQKLLAVQEALVRKVVSELKDFDNVYYEICNEPYERGGFAQEWNDRIIATIVDAESTFPHKHLIAEGIAVRSAKIEKPNPHVSVFNFHAATPEAVRQNYRLNKAIADDETGGKGTTDLPYRREAWEFILAGGGVFSHLDFSFTCKHPNGVAKLTTEPGGGGPELRQQLKVLKSFLESFDFVPMKPDDTIVQGGRITAPQTKQPLDVKKTAFVLAERGKAYAIYIGAGTQAELLLDLPAGSYKMEWVNTKTGKVDKAEETAHGGGELRLTSPPYQEDVALRLVSVPR
ncbi:MAG: sulfatase-like hydrolase/transferase, partial [Pirellulales bacterium]